MVLKLEAVIRLETVLPNTWLLGKDGKSPCYYAWQVPKQPTLQTRIPIGDARKNTFRTGGPHLWGGGLKDSRTCPPAWTPKRNYSRCDLAHVSAAYVATYMSYIAIIGNIATFTLRGPAKRVLVSTTSFYGSKQNVPNDYPLGVLVVVVLV